MRRIVVSLLVLCCILLPASRLLLADGVSAPGVPSIGGKPAVTFPPTSSGGGGLVYTPTDAKNTSPGYATSGSFPSTNIGTASADRIVIVGIINDQNTTFSSITIGGVSATLAIGNGVSALPNNDSIWYANVPTGTTATVAWTSAGVIDAMGIVVGTIHGQSGGGGATPNNTGSFTTAMAQPIGPIPSVTVTPGGLAFVMCGSGGARVCTHIDY